MVDTFKNAKNKTVIIKFMDKIYFVNAAWMENLIELSKKVNNDIMAGKTPFVLDVASLAGFALSAENIIKYQQNANTAEVK